jgi:hypothetical protein
MSMTTTNGAATDYFAVYKPASNGGLSHVCNAQARDEAHALRIARAHGMRLPRGSTATRIGLRGYARMVAATVPPPAAVRTSGQLEAAA